MDLSTPLGLPIFQTFNGENSNPTLGFYFCSEDKILLKNIKFGTFQEAESFCGSLWTPKLCPNETSYNPEETLQQKLYNMGVAIKDMTMKLEYPPELFDLTTNSFTEGFEELHRSDNLIMRK